MSPAERRKAAQKSQAALKVSCRSVQRSQLLQNLTFLQLKSHSILSMLLQGLRALCLALGGLGSIWNDFGALVRSTGVSGKFACGFRTDLYFANVTLSISLPLVPIEAANTSSMIICNRSPLRLPKM